MAAEDILDGEEFLNKFIEDLKCCGNCTHRESFIEDVSREYCNYSEEAMPSSGICPKWEFDNTDKKTRETL